jgi:hypothetical protein
MINDDNVDFPFSTSLFFVDGKENDYREQICTMHTSSKRDMACVMFALEALLLKHVKSNMFQDSAHHFAAFRASQSYL